MHRPGEMKGTSTVSLYQYRCLTLIAALGASNGCGAGYTPPTQPAPREATTVAATFEKAWNAVIDIFAAENIPIATLDKSSGFIVAARDAFPKQVRSDSLDSFFLADCGRYRNMQVKGGFIYPRPTSAKYNIVVRPIGSSSTVRVTATYLNAADPANRDCVSKGKFETTIEDRIKRNAEAR